MNAVYFNYIEKLKSLQSQLGLRGLVRESFETGGFLIGPDEARNGGPDIDLLILTLVHGNEAGSLVAAHDFLEGYLTGASPCARVAVLVCHQEAAAENVRFLERDLNRCFGIGDMVSLEGRKAQQLEKIILRSRYLIDLHQTNYETKSDFFIFPDSPSNIAFAAQLCANTPIITHGLDFSDDGYTSDTYATMNGIVSITYEMGQIGRANEQAPKTAALLKRAAALCQSELVVSARPAANVMTFSQRVTASSQKRLIPNLVNLSKIKKGEVIGYDDTAGPIVAEHDGYVLFPKYGAQAEKSAELCHVLRSL